MCPPLCSCVAGDCQPPHPPLSVNYENMLVFFYSVSMNTYATHHKNFF